MAPEEISKLKETLENSRQEFNASVGGLSELHAQIKPASGGWSVLECVEHVANAEQRFISWLTNAKRLETASPNLQKEAAIAAGVVDRSTKFEAPEPVRPTGRCTSVSQALNEFNDARLQAIQMAENRAGELHWLTVEHPRLGPINGAELLQLVAAHSRRHIGQIQEVRAAVEK